MQHVMLNQKMKPALLQHQKIELRKKQHQNRGQLFIPRNQKKRQVRRNPWKENHLQNQKPQLQSLQL